ncbi:MAG: hypothetical protein CBC35_10930 [Planctomycetes bacterium TMED75]|nr:Sterol desaturase [Planctomycetaceae bacterium]OUU90766.1 MAG: hypothetical protein CBC35_10930 [Planctomycetes bacterium TMED75]
MNSQSWKPDSLRFFFESTSIGSGVASGLSLLNMHETDLSFISPATAAISLALLWIAESLLPAFIEHRGSSRGGRWRNLFLAGLNILVASGFAGLILFVTNLSQQTNFGLLHQARSLLPESSTFTLLLVLASFVLLDLWGYAFHVLAHQVPWLWRFHALHHNADHFEVTLALRFHAVEIALQGLLSLPIYFLLGVGIQEVLLYQLVLMPIAFFHHCNVSLPGNLDRILSWVIVTPGMHLIHHSRWVRETDSNYAPVFSIWDRVFGSFRWRERPSTVAVGLDGFDEKQIHTLGGMLQTGLRAKASHPGERPSNELIPEALVERDDRVEGIGVSDSAPHRCS